MYIITEPEGWKKARRAEWAKIINTVKMMPPIFVNGKLPQGPWEGRVHMAVAGRRVGRQVFMELDMLEQQLKYEVRIEGINDDKARAFVVLGEYIKQAQTHA